MADPVVLSVAFDTTQGVRKLQSDLGSLQSKNIADASRDFQSLEKSIDSAVKRVIAFGISYRIFSEAAKGARELVDASISVNKSMTEIQSVLRTTTSGLDSFKKNIFDIARNTGQSFEEIASGAKILASQGLQTSEVLRRLSDSAILARISGESLDESISDVTAGLASFNREALTSGQLVSKLAALSQNNAVSVGTLSEAIRRGGEAASDSNVDFNQYLSLITSMSSITQASGSRIGNALKSIFDRSGRAGIIDQLKEFNVAVDSSSSGIQILQSVAKAWGDLSKPQQAKIGDSLGGVFQVNQLKAILHDLNSEYSIYNNALRESAGATDEATSRNEALNQSFSAIASQAGSTVKQFFDLVGEEGVLDPLKGVLKSFADLSQYLDSDTTSAFAFQAALKGIANSLTPIAIGLAGIAGGAFKIGIGSTLRYGEAVAPNFANPLADAIGREQNALTSRGIPSYAANSSIFVGHDSRVGIGVGNLFDEPSGSISQGVNRVLSMGGNPRMSGIPNYALSAKQKEAAQSLQNEYTAILASESEPQARDYFQQKFYEIANSIRLKKGDLSDFQNLVFGGGRRNYSAILADKINASLGGLEGGGGAFGVSSAKGENIFTNDDFRRNPIVQSAFGGQIKFGGQSSGGFAGYLTGPSLAKLLPTYNPITRLNYSDLTSGGTAGNIGYQGLALPGPVSSHYVGSYNPDSLQSPVLQGSNSPESDDQELLNSYLRGSSPSYLSPRASPVAASISGKKKFITDSKGRVVMIGGEQAPSTPFEDTAVPAYQRKLANENIDALIASESIEKNGGKFLAGIGGNIKSSFSNPLLASIGLGLLAAPFQQGAQANQGTALGGTLGGVGSALQYGGLGLQIGSIAGPEGAAIGATLGAIYGAWKGYNDGAKVSAEELGKSLENLQGKFKQNSTAAEGFLQTQSHLNDLLDSGHASLSDITTIFNQMKESLAGIDDSKLKAAIISNLGNPEGLQDAIAKYQIQGTNQIQTASFNADLASFLSNGKLDGISSITGKALTGGESEDILAQRAAKSFFGRGGQLSDADTDRLYARIRTSSSSTELGYKPDETNKQLINKSVSELGMNVGSNFNGDYIKAQEFLNTIVNTDAIKNEKNLQNLQDVFEKFNTQIAEFTNTIATISDLTDSMNKVMQGGQSSIAKIGLSTTSGLLGFSNKFGIGTALSRLSGEATLGQDTALQSFKDTQNKLDNDTRAKIREAVKGTLTPKLQTQFAPELGGNFDINSLLSTLTAWNSPLSQLNQGKLQGIQGDYSAGNFSNITELDEKTREAQQNYLIGGAALEGERGERMFGGNPFGVNVGGLGGIISSGGGSINQYLELQRRSGLVNSREGIQLGLINGGTRSAVGTNVSQGIKNQSLSAGSAALQQYNELKKTGFTDDDAASLLGVDKSVFSDITKQGSQNILNQFQNPSSILSSLKSGRSSLNARGRQADDSLIRNIENIQNGSLSDVNKRDQTKYALSEALRTNQGNSGFDQLTSGLSKRFGVQAANTPEEIQKSLSQSLDDLNKGFTASTEANEKTFTANVEDLITSLTIQITNTITAINTTAANLEKLKVTVTNNVNASIANGTFNGNNVTVQNGTFNGNTTSSPGQIVPTPRPAGPRAQVQ